jgi:chitin disaccharide deacetylase
VSGVLVVNADDFGLSPGINAGILRAHSEGIVTSTSLMVCRQAAEQAIELSQAHPRLSIGLHVDLGEWVYRDGEWELGPGAVDFTDPEAVEPAILDQLERFRDLTGADPTHLDSHQHVHREEPAATTMRRLAEELGVPLRGSDHGLPYHGEFYGQSGKGEPFPEGITVAALVAAIEGLPDGAHELGCHPGELDDSGSSYGAERAVELEALCSAEARAAAKRAGLRLTPFAEVRL